MAYFEGAYDVGMGNFLNANYNLEQYPYDMFMVLESRCIDNVV